MSKLANLRVCASCEWIFRLDQHSVECPKCQFGSYGARRVYGDKCYRFEKTQQPWYDKIMTHYSIKLRMEIDDFQSRNRIGKCNLFR